MATDNDDDSPKTCQRERAKTPQMWEQTHFKRINSHNSPESLSHFSLTISLSGIHFGGRPPYWPCRWPRGEVLCIFHESMFRTDVHTQTRTHHVERSPSTIRAAPRIYYSLSVDSSSTLHTCFIGSTVRSSLAPELVLKVCGWSTLLFAESLSKSEFDWYLWYLNCDKIKLGDSWTNLEEITSESYL